MFHSLALLFLILLTIPITASATRLVAVIDTGIDLQNPLFKNQLWTNGREIPDNGVDDDNNGFVDDYHGWNCAKQSGHIQDDHGHGTHVSSLILQGQGLRLAPPTDVRLVVLKYTEQKQSGQAGLQAFQRCLQYLARFREQLTVINISGGGATADPLEQKLILGLQQQGRVIIAAAGNHAQDLNRHPFFPASYGGPRMITVGALTQNGTPLASSNFGKNAIDVYAPGEKIRGFGLGSQIKVLSGTSQATALVTHHWLLRDEAEQIEGSRLSSLNPTTPTANLDFSSF